MFRAIMDPSSGETTVFMRHLVLFILCEWLSGMQEHMLLHTISWWWAHNRPKHVEINKYKYTENKLCTKLVLFTRRSVLIIAEWQNVSVFYFRALKRSWICPFETVISFCFLSLIDFTSLHFSASWPIGGFSAGYCYWLNSRLSDRLC